MLVFLRGHSYSFRMDSLNTFWNFICMRGCDDTLSKEEDESHPCERIYQELERIAQCSFIYFFLGEFLYLEKETLSIHVYLIGEELCLGDVVPGPLRGERDILSHSY